MDIEQPQEKRDFWYPVVANLGVVCLCLAYSFVLRGEDRKLRTEKEYRQKELQEIRQSSSALALRHRVATLREMQGFCTALSKVGATQEKFLGAIAQLGNLSHLELNGNEVKLEATLNPSTLRQLEKFAQPGSSQQVGHQFKCQLR